MRFESRPPYVVAHDSRPRQSVGLSVNGVALLLDGNACSFSDARRAYAWAFVGIIEAGDRLVFTAEDAHFEVVYGPEVERGVRVLVGAGSDAPKWSKEGWLCNDIAEAAQIYDGITLVAPCWQLPVEDGSVDEIMARGMLEHLTYHEVARAFKEWMRVLRPGGYFTGEVPDVDEYIREYLKMRADPSIIGSEGSANGAEGEPADFEVCTGIDRWLRRALYGWQRWPGDEHRSGWTEELFKFYLNQCGASRVEVRRMSESFEADDPTSRVHHLWARAWK